MSLPQGVAQENEHHLGGDNMEASRVEIAQVVETFKKSVPFLDFQRAAVLTGLPESVTAWRCFITDAHRGMEEHGRVEARSGTAGFVLPPAHAR
jgi:hypothetical protein